MHPKEKIIKSVHNCFEGTKDIVGKNVALANKEGKIKLEASTLQQLLSLINLSIDESFHKTHSMLNREVTSALESLSDNSTKKK
jgi:hypothetical protein